MQKRLFIIVSVAAGFFWGAWARGYPVVIEATPVAFIPTMTAGSSNWCFSDWNICDGNAQNRCHRKFTSINTHGVGHYSGSTSWLVDIWTSTRGNFSCGRLSAIVVLIVYCIMTLWFQDQPQPQNLLSERLPVKSPPKYYISHFGFALIYRNWRNILSNSSTGSG